MTVRTQIYLSPEQHRALSTEARRQGISLAALVRGLAQRYMRERRAPGKPRLLALARLGESGLGDASERHDAYVGAAVAREVVRR